MDKAIEEAFISSFISEWKKNQARRQLRNHDKRNSFLWNIEYHNWLDNRYAHQINIPVNSYKVVYDILKENGAPDECYIIADGKDYDGKTMPLKDALETAVFCGPAIISCITGKLAYYEGHELDENIRLVLRK